MRFSRILLNLAEPPAMANVRQLLKSAMRSGNVVEKTTLRAVMSAVKNADIAKPGSVSSDIAFSGLLQSLIKKREQSIAEYTAGSRADLAASERDEVSVLNKLVADLNLATPSQIEEYAQKFVAGLNLGPETKNGFQQIMAKLPKDIEEQWKAPKSAIVSALKKSFGGPASSKREFSTLQRSRAFSASALNAHDNPLGLRRRSKPATVDSVRAIRNVDRIILVSSAKGGVGKSTVSVNLALGLQSQGYSTGILDADIFGPSVPKMLGLEAESEPRLTPDGSRLIPLIGHGLRAMSMGFLVPPDKSVSWRGLLVQKALNQLLFEVEWGPLNYLIVDMPPGTGDVQLTIGQQLKIDGAVIVTTPQEVAVIDARRGIDLFERLKIPVLGYVENMAYFGCSHCGTPTRIFGPEPDLPLKKLGEIPLLPEVAQQADAGRFTARPAYTALARNVADCFVHK